ncbi:HNH endonuclease family protein [Helicobacter himalayensis]|uniref:HNH endonuclease family protein n=1 Tax=Helicobacter himalayensis TaxID=1591088 RepID=UPI003D6DBFF3
MLDKMVLMRLEEKDSGRAIRMFQTVNDRGVELLILEKLKSLLILYSNKYCKGELDEEINKRFGEIFKIIVEIRNHPIVSSLADRYFAKEIESRIFNYHALGQKGIGHYRYGADEAYKKLKDLLKEKLKELQGKENEVEKEQILQNLRDWLDTYSEDLLKFFKAFLEVAKMTENNVEAFKLLYILKINPFFYASLVRLKINNILDDECLKLFAQAEICFFGLGSTNDATAYKLYEFDRLKNTFGNLLVLEKNLNSECSDAGLAKKQEIYKKSNVFYNRQFANGENFLSFNKDSIKQENEKFTQWAKEFFEEFL